MTGSRPMLMGLSLAAILSVCSNGVQAEVPPLPESQRMLQARLDALRPHFSGGSLARWSNPDDHKVLQALWDPAMLGAPPYSGEDVAALAGLLKAQASVLQMYTTAGHATPGSPKEARVRTKYQDEIVRSSAYLTATSAALLQAMGAFVIKLKPQQLDVGHRRGIDEGRAGVRSLIESFTTQLELPEVTPENKMLLVDALAANAQIIAAYSPEEDRKRYARAAGAVLAKLPAAEKAKLQAFIAAMDTKTCEGLCTLKG